MYRDFYGALAQVLPVLLLALMWDSAYLERLRQQRRTPRALGPGGVRFWTKPRVRAYTLLVAGVVIACIGAAVLVLAGVLADSRALRIALSASTVLVLLTLLVRISVDVIDATTDRDQPTESPRPE